MTPPIRLIIFDMAGTTVHDDDYVNLFLRRALEHHGISCSRDDVNTVMGWPKAEAIRQVLVARNEAADPARVEAIHASYLEGMEQFYASDPHVREIEGATQLFETLRERGIKVALETGFNRSTADLIIERLGWRHKIDASASSDEVLRGRPHPDLAYFLMDKVGVPDPELVAKVGDTVSDLGEGAAAGCRYNIGVLSGAYTREALAAMPHTHLIDSVADLPQVLGL
ncbi:MAG: phosphonatase-like hydrolase [Bacteroidia bacterium]